MTFQDMNISDSHLEVYFSGIRQKFNHLNQQLDEARNQRDEYKRNYTNQAKELQDLRQILFGTTKAPVVCRHCCGTSNDDLSSSSSSESYFSMDEEESRRGENVLTTYSYNRNDTRKDSTISGNTFLAPPPDIMFPQPHEPHGTYNVEFNHDTKVALKLMHTLTQNTDTTYAAFSMDGNYLATVSQTGILHTFDVKTGKGLSVMRDLYKSRNERVPSYRCLGFSADGKFLATAESDGDVKIWILSQRRVRNTFKHQGADICSLDFSPNVQYIAISCGQTVGIRRLRDGFSRVIQQNHLDFSWSVVRFSQDGRHIALSGRNPQEDRIKIFNVQMGKCLARHTRGHVGAVQGLVFAPDGEGLFSSSWDTTVMRWDVSWLKSTCDVQKEDLSTQYLTGGLRETSRFVGHKGCAFAIAISPDGNWIASGSLDETVRIWNAHTGRLQCILHGHGRVVSVDFSRVGNYLAVGDWEGQVTIWNYRKLDIEPE